MSWRFAEGIEQLPLTALFVRDAIGLDVPADAVIPPHLDAELPDRSGLLNAGQRQAAGAQWAIWWQAVVSHDVRGQQGANDDLDQRAWLRQRMAEASLLFDPPEFVALRDRPALREAVRATYDESLQWASGQRRALLIPPNGRTSQFDYDTVRAVAELVVPRHRVDPGAVRGCALVLPVEGKWWHRFKAGAVVCSVHAAHDPSVARAALTDAFECG